MKNEIVITMLGSVLASSVIGILVQGYFDRNKRGAETHNLNISGELSIGESWQKYATQQKIDKEELRKEFLLRLEVQSKEHRVQMDTMKKEFSTLIKLKDDRIEELERRVEELQLEINKRITL